MTSSPTSARAAVPAQLDFHTLSIPEALAAEEVDEQRGLSTAQAEERRRTFGPNRFAEGEQEPRWRAFLRQYADLMQIVLLVAGLGSIWPLKEYGTGFVLLFLTLFNAVLGLQQEGKAAAAVAALQKMMIVKAKTRRDGRLVELPAEELVPGDVVNIEAGDLVPADGRLLRAATLEVAESALTGESLPVSKGIDAVPQVETPLGDRTDMVYMNTNVTRGAGTFVVTATGMSTEVGHVSGMLQAQDDSETPLTRQLAALTNQILVIAGIALLVTVVINLARGNEFTVVFTAAIAFAISAIPTGLPAVVTTILSYGTRMLADVERDREAPAVGRDARLDVRHQLRQDRNPHPEPDDGRGDDAARSSLRDLGERVLDRGCRQARVRPARGAAGPVPAPHGPGRRRHGPGRRDGRRPHGGRPRRARREGRAGRRGHAPALPAHRRAAVRRRLQAHGDVPPDDRRVRPRRRALPRQGRPRPAAGPRRPHARSRRPPPRPGRRRLPAAVPGGEPAPGRAGSASARDRPQGLRARDLRPAAATCSPSWTA